MADELAGSIALLRARQEGMRRDIEGIDRAIQQLESIRSMIDPDARQVSGEYANMSIGEAAKHVLTELGQPATTREIAEKLLSRGIRTTSKNFPMTTYTIIRETPGILKVAQGLWGLIGRDEHLIKKDGKRKH